MRLLCCIGFRKSQPALCAHSPSYPHEPLDLISVDDIDHSSLLVSLNQGSGILDQSEVSLRDKDIADGSGIEQGRKLLVGLENV
jgi:hypothetical protein